MPLVCTVFGHIVGSTRHRNQGLEFGICHTCGCDLIRGEGEWTEVPKGFRVVWREFGRATDAASVASRMHRIAVPPSRRRLPRSGRPAPRRDPRGRPVRNALSMLELLTSLGQLVRASDDKADTEVPRDGGDRPICLPRR